MNWVEQSRSLDIFICVLIISEPMVTKCSCFFLNFSIGIGKAKMMSLLS